MLRSRLDVNLHDACHCTCYFRRFNGVEMILVPLGAQIVGLVRCIYLYIRIYLTLSTLILRTFDWILTTI